MKVSFATSFVLVFALAAPAAAGNAKSSPKNHTQRVKAAAKRHQKYFTNSQAAVKNGAIPPFARVFQLHAGATGMLHLGARVALVESVAAGRFNRRLVLSPQAGLGVVAGVHLTAGRGTISPGPLRLTAKKLKLPIIEQGIEMTGLGRTMELTNGRQQPDGAIKGYGLALGTALTGFTRLNLSAPIGFGKTPVTKLLEQGVRQSKQAERALERGEPHVAAERVVDMQRTRRQYREAVSKTRAQADSL